MATRLPAGHAWSHHAPYRCAGRGSGRAGPRPPRGAPGAGGSRRRLRRRYRGPGCGRSGRRRPSRWCRGRGRRRRGRAAGLSLTLSPLAELPAAERLSPSEPASPRRCRLRRSGRRKRRGRRRRGSRGSRRWNGRFHWCLHGLRLELGRRQILVERHRRPGLRPALPRCGLLPLFEHGPHGDLADQVLVGHHLARGRLSIGTDRHRVDLDAIELETRPGRSHSVWAGRNEGGPCRRCGAPPARRRQPARGGGARGGPPPPPPRPHSSPRTATAAATTPPRPPSRT